MTEEKKKEKVVYKCSCCGSNFDSGRVRSGDKLCAECIGLRRSIKGFMKGGLTKEQILVKVKKLL